MKRLVNPDVLSYFSGYPIDKIIVADSYTMVNDGATDQSPQTAKIYTETIDNPVGRKLFPRYVWTVNQDDYHSSDTHLVYTFDLTITVIPITETLSGLQAATNMGCSATTISFRTGSGYHGDVEDDGVTYTYTPTSQTFTFNYALFEVE